jgi:hypothetical protein
MRYIISCIATGFILSAFACTTAEKQTAIVDGQLFCAKSTPLGPLTVAIATAAGVPVIVAGMASSGVAAICAEIAAIPVTPPVLVAAVPVVAVAIPAGVVIPGAQ